MPAKSVKSGLAAKLGKELLAAHEENKDKETEYSKFSGLPAGIEAGVAQLQECKFDVYKEGDNKGKYFFSAMGVVVAPKEHEGAVIEGLQTRLSEPIFKTDTRTRKTVAEHLDWIYNELRKLGVDTKTIDPNSLEAVAQELQDQQPFFKFRTWKGKKQTTGAYKDQEPRVQHSWEGVIADYSPDGKNPDPVADDTTTAGDEGTTTAGDDDVPDLDALGAAADKKKPDEEAIEQLQTLAAEAGIEKDIVDGADNWTAVAEMIKEAQASSVDGGNDETTAAEEDPTAWIEKERMVKYTPIDPKTKKPMVNVKTKKPVVVECEITDVQAKKKTVTLKNTEDGRSEYKNVAFDKIEPVEA